ncbi:RepA leader peptide Tap (plasmid) [Escherichia coli]|nr:RepA leader peptide Tap [Escherichia coli]
MTGKVQDFFLCSLLLCNHKCRMV